MFSYSFLFFFHNLNSGLIKDFQGNAIQSVQDIALSVETQELPSMKLPLLTSS